MPCPSCEDERGVCSQSGLPCSQTVGSVVGLALHRGSTSLPCHPESPREGESGVTVAVIWHKRQLWTHGLKDFKKEFRFLNLKSEHMKVVKA